MTSLSRGVKLQNAELLCSRGQRSEVQGRENNSLSKRLALCILLSDSVWSSHKIVLSGWNIDCTVTFKDSEESVREFLRPRDTWGPLGQVESVVFLRLSRQRPMEQLLLFSPP